MTEGETNSFFDVPTVAIVTGASRSIGRAFATGFAKRFTKKLHLILVGKREIDLQETASLIQADDGFSSSKTTLLLVIGDLGNRDSVNDLIEDLFRSVDPSKYEHAILVNNVASIGDVTKFVREWDSTATETVNDYFFMNVVSTFFLISKFLSTFADRQLQTADGLKPV